MPHEEDQFRATMKTLREASGMTQTELANKMRDRGFAFHQQTIQKIESGERPVRLDEAYALADELGSNVGAMISGPQLVHIAALGRQVAQTFNAMVSAAEAFEAHRMVLALTLDAEPLDPDESVGASEISALVDRWLNVNVSEALDVSAERATAERAADEARANGASVISPPVGPAMARLLTARERWRSSREANPDQVAPSDDWKSDHGEL